MSSEQIVIKEGSGGLNNNDDDKPEIELNEESKLIKDSVLFYVDKTLNKKFKSTELNKRLTNIEEQLNILNANVSVDYSNNPSNIFTERGFKYFFIFDLIFIVSGFIGVALVILLSGLLWMEIESENAIFLIMMCGGVFGGLFFLTILLYWGIKVFYIKRKMKKGVLLQ